ncbi:MAG TPA: response regulator [Gemmatimonadales bacterium]|nr:response regulator [Gemmatimonadales bacterium]
MRLLLVEDDPKVGAFLEEGLSLEGFKLDWAHDGEQAIELARDTDYDLILLDFMLPKKNGLEVAGNLRSRGSQTPILMLTARDSAEDIRRITAAGVNGCMGKPFKLDDLLDRIHSLLR